MGHIFGMDGMRGISVIAVLLYHAGFRWMQGGFLGVEVFFVLSGFLITRLLLNEHQSKGFIDLGLFWRRRLKRLLPAMLACLFAVSTLALFLGDKSSQFRMDLLASLFYLENWHQVSTGGSYFADQGLPLLRHLWSLAVEGQFYLVWPLWLAAILWLRPVVRKIPKAFWSVVPKEQASEKIDELWHTGYLTTGLWAAGSWMLMQQLAEPHHESSVRAMESLNRAYLGTDTRAMGLLMGSLLAMFPGFEKRNKSWGWTLDMLSLPAFAALLVLMVFMEGTDAGLYRWGFLAVDVLTLILLAALLQPASLWTRSIFSLPPLEWLGQRSYGLYLWHWPIFRLVAPENQELSGLGLRLGLTLVVTEASYRFLETPIRQGALKRWMKPAATSWKGLAFRCVTALLILLGVGEGYVLAQRPAYVDPVMASIRQGEAALDQASRPSGLAPIHQELIRITPENTAESDGPPLPLFPDPIPMPEKLHGCTVTAIGDSVMKGAALPLKSMAEASLGQDGLHINAEENRTFAQALKVIARYKAEKRLGEIVVLHLGTNNSSIPEKLFHQIMEQLADRRLVLFLTVKSNKEDACDSVNADLGRWVAKYANARLLNWREFIHPYTQCFYNDQTHLRPIGARAYAAWMLQNLAQQADQLKPAEQAAGIKPLLPAEQGS